MLNFADIIDRAQRYKNIIQWIFAILVFSIVITCYFNDTLLRMELLSIDYRFRLRPAATGSPDVVFIDMGEDSIDAIGSWPWPRKWHAAIVSILSKYNPKAIAFDVIFSEPQDEENDGAFEEALKKPDKVYMPVLYNLRSSAQIKTTADYEAISVLEPIPRFKKWIAATGHINVIPDPDGILRRTPFYMRFKDESSYQLAFKVGCDMLGVKEKDITFEPDRNIAYINVPDADTIKVPLDRDNNLIINWAGRWGKAFKHYSFLDVIRSYAMQQKGEKPIIDLNELRDKVCIIGLTASGLIDIRPTPLENAYPGVGTNATIINSILNNNFISVTPKLLDIAIILIVSFLITLLLFRLAPLRGMYVAILGIIALSLIHISEPTRPY